MKLVLNSVTYRDCPVQLREIAAFTPEQRRAMLRRMHAEQDVSEAVVLETCNRLEIYLYAKKSFDCAGFLADTIRQVKPKAVDVWKEHRSENLEIDAVKHLFEVAAGLDSQMLGENQILAQAKSAYTESLNCRMSRLIFHKLFHYAFRVGKAVRSTTSINCGAVSIGLAAVELAKKRLDLSKSSAMVIGAGENAELVIHYLLKAGIYRMLVANRSPERAEAIASSSDVCEVVALQDVAKSLASVDLVISSTASAEPIIMREAVADMLADRSKPLLMVDVAVPRDIEPQVGLFDCVTLVNIDDLSGQIDANRQKRNEEIPKARAIISEFTDEFARWYHSLDIVPVISKLTQEGLNLAQNEARRYAKDFDPDNAEKLRAFAESLVKKVLHGPITFIKEGGGGEPSTEQLEAAELINKMFLLKDQGER